MCHCGSESCYTGAQCGAPSEHRDTRPPPSTSVGHRWGPAEDGGSGAAATTCHGQPLVANNPCNHHGAAWDPAMPRPERTAAGDGGSSHVAWWRVGLLGGLFQALPTSSLPSSGSCWQWHCHSPRNWMFFFLLCKNSTTLCLGLIFIQSRSTSRNTCGAKRRAKGKYYYVM